MTKPILYLMLLVGGALAAGAGIVTYGEWRQAQRTAAAVVPAGPAESDVAPDKLPIAGAEGPATADESLSVPQPAPSAPASPVPEPLLEADREVAALPQPEAQGMEESQQAPPAKAGNATPETRGDAAGPSGQQGAREAAPASEPSADGKPSTAAPRGESAALQERNEVPAPSAEAPRTPGPEPAEPRPAVPSFDIVRVEPTGEAVIAGNASGGATVEVLSNGELVARTSADESGNWVALPERPLKPGSHDLTIRAVKSSGEEMTSEQHVAVAVPERPGEEVVAVLGAPGQPSEVLAGPDGDAPAASEPPQKLGAMATATGVAGASGAAAGGAPVLTVDAVEAEGRTMYVAGAGDPGALVRVYVDDELLGEAQAGAGGRWLVEAARALEEEGEITVRADQLKAGTAQVEARAEVPFVRRLDMAALVPAARGGAGAGDNAEGGDLPRPDAVIIRRGDNLWTISRRTYGRGVRYTTIYRANQDQIRDPHWIYPGQVFMLPERDRAWAQQ